MSDSCPICLEKCTSSRDGNKDATIYNCPRCGRYSISRTVAHSFKMLSISERQRINASSYVRETVQNMITSYMREDLFSIPTPTFHQRADKLLLQLEENTEEIGKFITLDHNNTEWQSITWCSSATELKELIVYLCSNGRIETDRSNGRGNIKIKPNGWERLNEIHKSQPDNSQAFIAMWFNNCMEKHI